MVLLALLSILTVSYTHLRSLGRVSVPMWPFNLSVRLLIVDLVSRYLTNYLIGRESILQRIAPLIAEPCDPAISCGISAVSYTHLDVYKRQISTMPLEITLTSLPSTST